MSVITESLLSINYSSSSDPQTGSTDSCAKFPPNHSGLDFPKGHLFIIADAKTGSENNPKAATMAVRSIGENYYEYPSEDTGFRLRRAFDIANRQIYQYAQTNGLYGKFGATCSALVLTEMGAYVAHIGDCRIFHINKQQIRKVTHQQGPVIKTISQTERESEKNDTIQTKDLRSTRALGVKLGIKIETSDNIRIQAGDYFLLCTDGLQPIPNSEIQEIITSNPPSKAANALLKKVRTRGGKDDVTIQVVKIGRSPGQPGYRKSALYDVSSNLNKNNGKSASSKIRKLTYGLIALIMMTGLFLSRDFFVDQFKRIFLNQQTENVEQDERFSIPAMLSEDYQLERAERHLVNGNLNKALNVYNAILRENNGEHPQARRGIIKVARAYENLGNSNRREGNWKQAINYYQTAMEINPDAKQHLVNLILDCKRRLYLADVSKSDEDELPNLSSTATNTVPSPITEQHFTVKFEPPYWDVRGLDYNSDYILLENGITFFESIRVKKAFYKTLYDSIEMDVQTRVINAEEEGKYGVIFGHDLDERGRYHHFYLFSINTDFEYSLERITDNQIDVLDSAPVQPSVADGNKFTHLKVKSLGQLVLLYANGDLLNMLKVDKPDTCGFGFYADPKLQVKFSDFKISPVQVK